MPRYNTQAHCRGCGRPIDFVQTPAGKYMPVDPAPLYMEPHPEGDERLVNSRGEVVRCFIADAGAHYDPRKVAHRPHWDTCPEAPRLKAQAERAARVKREAEERRAAQEAAEAAKREELEAQGRQVTLFEVMRRE